MMNPALRMIRARKATRCCSGSCALVARLPAAPRAVVLLRFQEDMDPTRDR